MRDPYPDDEDGEPGWEKNTIADESSGEPDEGEMPVDELKLFISIGPGHQVPTLQFLSYKSRKKNKKKKFAI